MVYRTEFSSTRGILGYLATARRARSLAIRTLQRVGTGHGLAISWSLGLPPEQTPLSTTRVWLPGHCPVLNRSAPRVPSVRLGQAGQKASETGRTRPNGLPPQSLLKT